jgi:uncharacterized protein (DUF608 family)
MNDDRPVGDEAGTAPLLPRRDFLRLSGAAATSLALTRLPMAAGIARFVPEQKVLPEWGKTILARGSRSVYRGSELRYIGMPVGGICAGQVYIGGDGRLWLWDIFNEIKLGTVAKRVEYRGGSFDALGGANYIQPPEQVHPFAQGFALQIETPTGSQVRPFDATGWSDVAFTGEYPLAFVEYRDPASPVEASLEAFSPFIPLDADDSGLPLVVMSYTLRNRGTSTVRAQIGGWMENPVGLRSAKAGEVTRHNRSVDGRIEFLADEPASPAPARPAIVFEDWSRTGFGTWTVAGDAFGPGPVDSGAIPGLSGTIGGPGGRLVKSYRVGPGETNVQGDARTGRLTSREFTIERRFVEFWIGGGNHPKTAVLNLLVDDKVVRTATGRQEDMLRLERFDVAELAGRRARIEIVDEERGFWGQIGVGRIQFVDVPSAVFKDAPDYGAMALSFVDPKPADRSIHNLGDAPLDRLFSATPHTQESVEVSAPSRPRSGLVRTVELRPGESVTVPFVVAWRFPNLTINRLGKVGNHYAERFPTVGAVVEHLRKDYGRLSGSTRQWHRTWYDSTLPYWLLDRTMANAATLATMTCVRFGNGRFYGWEGVGCCDGTCGHVWQYAQTVGRLFPSLERSVREMVDFGVAFHPDSGLIDFRGEYGFGYAADAQAGYVLRAYREHQTSTDDGFLRRVWPRVRKAMEYLIEQDTDDDGILEGRQHNTLDVDLYGPSSWLTSLYLAALKASAAMAAEMGDAEFRRRCQRIFDAGSSRFDQVFWDGDYYVQRLNLREQPDALRYGNGCEIDQVMGQGWAWQLGLGRITSPGNTRKALKSLYRNNFLTDVGNYRDQHKPGRWYAMPEEAGLLMCTFPKGNRQQILGEKPTWASMYFNECWTGSEYEAAGHMVAEGLVEEGLTVARAVHERHHPSRRNPWNEVECSDHYARCMSVHGVFTAACGFEYHGPKGHLGFAPRIRPEDFRAAFSAAEGWGTIGQKITSAGMQASVKVAHGKLALRTLALQVPSNLKGSVKASVGGKALKSSSVRTGDRLTISFPDEVRLNVGDALVVTIASSLAKTE